MQIFEVVKKLEEIRDEHGDLEVFFEGEAWMTSIREIEVQGGGANEDNEETVIFS